jgi:zinc-ribbon domain
MFCHYCGADNPDEAVFCTHCGTKLSADYAPEPTQEYQQPQQPEQPPEWLAEAPLISASDDRYSEASEEARRKSLRRRRQIRSLMNTAVALLVIAGLIVGAVLLYRHYQKTGIAGKYIHETNNADSLTLNSDKTFSLTEQGLTVSGTYEVTGNSITLTATSVQGLPPQTGTIDGNTITDPDGERWTK